MRLWHYTLKAETNIKQNETSNYTNNIINLKHKFYEQE